MSAIALRRATAADAEALARSLVDGLAGYPAFAPPGWTPPSPAGEAAHLRELLTHEHVVCLVAEHDGILVGQVTVLPAAQGPRPVEDPGLAHLSNLVVDRDHWGTGLARRLSAAAVRTAGEQGFSALRLFVAEGQARARRFYEREGWEPVSDPFFDPRPGLDLVEYRIPTTAGPGGRSG